MPYDYFNREIHVGDYLFCAVHACTSSVATFVGKVIKINPASISVMGVHSWSKYPTISVLKLPERHMIISEEIALQKASCLKDI